MLAIGRALMSRPRLLLLDEPSMGLAPRVVQEIFATIGRLNAGGMSILLAEQNADMALQNSDWATCSRKARSSLTPKAFCARSGRTNALSRSLNGAS